MLLGILSDTHDQMDRTRRAAAALAARGATALVHTVALLNLETDALEFLKVT